MTPPRRSVAWKVAGGCLVGSALAVFLVRTVQDLITTRGAVATYARLIAAANAQDQATIRTLCTDRFLRGHPPRPAAQGGTAGFPRQIHPNFRAWVRGREVWLCPGNRVGLVARFVRPAGPWLYDGEVGLLQADGRIVQPEPVDPGESWEKP